MLDILKDLGDDELGTAVHLVLILIAFHTIGAAVHQARFTVTDRLDALRRHTAVDEELTGSIGAFPG